MRDFDDYGETKLVRPAWARWLTRLMLLICGLLMAAVMLSQPKVAARFEKKTMSISQYLSVGKFHLFGSREDSAALAPSEASGGTVPVVSTLPQTRVPVNRAGIVSGD